MSSILAVASGKGGVGKTLTTAALSTLLSRKGYRVLAVDGDMGLRNLDLPFGVQDRISYDMLDILKKRCIAEEAILSVVPGLDFLAASQKKTWEKVDASLFQKKLKEISQGYDYVLIDCPPGRGLAYHNAVSVVDMILFVVEPTKSSIRDMKRVLQYCHKHHMGQYAGIFNNFYRDTEGYVTPYEAQDELSFEQIAGILPHSERAHRLYGEGHILSLPESDPYVLAMEYTLAWLLQKEEIPFTEIVQTLPTIKSASSHHMGEIDSMETSIRNGDSRVSIQERRRQVRNWRHFHR